ncbi:hypothetical protein [Paenibacillus turpanensis]|uniref:hypothetical protein n=1 Tax=Paenibacillus turpanensis TaxID=2689078 RepID=UPI001407BD1F|nr:hypothetical protein [Paenibacillus turpanensis]
MSEDKRMDPMTGEKVEVTGTYETEWGREEQLKRGDRFPVDLALGETEWKMVSYELDDAQKGETQKGVFGTAKGEKAGEK